MENIFRYYLRIIFMIFISFILNSDVLPQQQKKGTVIFNDNTFQMPGRNSHKTKPTNHFVRVQDSKANTYSLNSTTDISGQGFYRLNKGDIREFIETSNYSFSMKQEIVKDTTLSNNVTYTQIKWSNMANSIVDTPRYEYQRTDSSGERVYIYIKGEDRLLYDFTKNVGEEYNSPYPGLYWKVLDKYRVKGFNGKFNAVDIALLDSKSIIRRRETIIEKFGLIYYPEGSFWGAILSDTTYGELLAIDNRTKWEEYYPLHVGDMWKYLEWTSTVSYIFTKAVVKDTIPYDGNVFKKIKTVYYPSHDSSFSYERIDSLGNIYLYDIYSKHISRIFKLSSCVGDTFYNSIRFLYRIDDKQGYYDPWLKRNNFELVLRLKYEPVPYDPYFAKNIGIRYIQFEWASYNLLGAVINGVAYGDTAYLTKVDEKSLITSDFKLYQNYPNPFNSSTRIKYYLPEDSKVNLEIFSITGEKITELTDQFQNSGSHEALWNGKDSNERSVSSGIYFYRLKTVTEKGKGTSIVRKLIILK